MHVGIVGPCSSSQLADFLPESRGEELGHIGYFVANLVRALIGRGHRVSVITVSPHLTERRILTGPQLTYYGYPERTTRRMRDLYKLERQGLKEGILLAKPDLLHAQWTYEFALACLETGLPMLATCHDNAFQILRFSTDLYRLGRLFIQLWVIRKVRFLTAPSRYLAHSLRWLAQEEITVIPNIIEMSQVPTSKADRGGNHVKIATVLNGWQRRKNPKVAIKAFNLLRRDLPSAEMFMYGYDFEEGGPAAQWAACKGLNQNIHFCGFVPNLELQKQLRQMSILLHPALEESFGMAIGEAMALELPVVAGINSGAIEWVLDGGQAGFLTDVRKPENIAEALLTCIKNPEERERRQRSAYQRIHCLFSPDTIARQYEKMYEKVLSAH